MPINARTLFGFLGSFPRNLKQLNPSDAVLKAVVGVDAGHSRSRRRSVTDVGLPLAGTHRPGSLHRFYGNPRRIRNFSLGRQSRRPLRRSFDAHVSRRGRRLCPPAGYIGFTEIFGETAASQRADVGIGPYRTPANPYFPASFERKAFLQQILNRSYSQIWCTITGGAYQIARRVSTCVRNICKSDSCLNRTAGRAPRPQALLFFPIFSGKTEKIGPSETSRSIIFP